MILLRYNKFLALVKESNEKFSVRWNEFGQVFNGIDLDGLGSESFDNFNDAEDYFRSRCFLMSGGDVVRGITVYCNIRLSGYDQ